MIDNIASKARKMVTIVDPHIKRDDNYHIHKQAKQQDLYVKNRDNQEYDGWCWPGMEHMVLGADVLILVLCFFL